MELAFWRPVANEGLEVVFAHPNGITEVETGTIHEGRIDLVSHRIAASPTAKEVTRLERTLVVDGDTLTYEQFLTDSFDGWDGPGASSGMWRGQNLASVADRWGSVVGHENVVIVTVPPT